MEENLLNTYLMQTLGTETLDFQLYTWLQLPEVIVPIILSYSVPMKMDVSFSIECGILIITKSSKIGPLWFVELM